MDELSADALREAATAANLRRAFGTPAADLPQAFATLLRRLREAEAACPRGRMGGGLGAGSGVRGGGARSVA